MPVGHGLEVLDAAGLEYEIAIPDVQARIDAETTMAGLAPERVLFAGDSLWINTAGLAYGPDTVIRIGLTLAP